MSKRIKVKAIRITPILIVVDDDDDDFVLDKDIGFQDLSPGNVANWMENSWPDVIGGHRAALVLEEEMRAKNDELARKREEKLAARRAKQHAKGEAVPKDEDPDITAAAEAVEDQILANMGRPAPVVTSADAGLTAREKAVATGRRKPSGRVTAKKTTEAAG